MSEFVAITDARQIVPGEATCVRIAGRKIAVFNIDGVYYAIDDACSHRGAPLSEGRVYKQVVTCPWHGATFDVTTGEALASPAPHGVRSYKVQVVDGKLHVEIPVSPDVCGVDPDGA
jgi:nitrite reductase/ring-hydroxylating ferredoxin subunit